MKFHTALNRVAIAALLLSSGPTFAQSFRVQCPNGTPLHPSTTDDAGHVVANPGIKCQHIAGSDGFATMADGNQIYLFGFAPLSGLASLQNAANALPGTYDAYVGTKAASEFNKPYVGPIVADGSSVANPANGSVDASISEPAMMMNMGVLAANIPAPLIAVDEDDEFFLTLSNVGMIMRPDLFEQHTVHWHGYPNASSYFDG
ncbi:MAG: multicopper oxidase family protein, partial [Pseudomonadota bacterium]|nr:multicopper oxidase family protein [Pseudomonadota bacterium]